MDWTEAHRPRTLAQLVGNAPSIAKLKAWAESWQKGVPETRAVVLAGPPGTGKTSAALALAADMGWTVIELNASDARNAETIRKVATAGAVHQTFAPDGSFHTGGEAAGQKLILLDEADNLYERLSGENAAGGGSDLSDRGGKTQIIDTIRRSRQPIILIVNDLYALQKGSGAALRSLAETLKFTKVNVRSIPAALARVCKEEGITADRDVLEGIALRAQGDLRAAVRDLESICLGRTRITTADLASLGSRDVSGSLFDLMRHTLKGRKIDQLRKEMWDVDATPEDLVLWVDENIPKEYKDPGDLVRAYEMLSNADIMLGRSRRRQWYGSWGYASELAILGVMTARRNEYRGFTPFGFPQWLSKMSRSRGLRQTKGLLASALARETHQSAGKARQNQVEPFAALYALDPEFAAHQTARLGLDAEQVALLLGEKSTSRSVKTIIEAAAAIEAAPPDVAGVAGVAGVARGLLADKERAPTGRPTRRATGEADRPGDPGDAADADGDGRAPESADGPGSKDEDEDGAGQRPRPGSGQARLF